MKKILLMLAIISMVSCGSVETGNVGVRTGSFTGKVELEEVQQGFYTSWISNVIEYSAKEITVGLNNMTPKAKDNLSLEDMDLEIYYTIESNRVADIHVKYANRHAEDPESGIIYAAYRLVSSLAREVVYSEVAKYNSLEIHKNRDLIRDAVKVSLQSSLDSKDKGVFNITKIVVRNIKTDSSVEEAIKKAVAKNKELEAVRIQIDISKQQALANIALDASLTDKILRQKELEVMESAVNSGSKPIVIFGGSTTPLINIKGD